MRTAAAAEAAKLENHLKGLLVMGKAFLGDNNDPQMQAVNQLFDRIQIASQASSVSLSIYLPKEFLELFNESKKTRVVGTR
jgi:hypothetical protein